MSVSISFKGRNVLVTGAANGIGLTIVKRFLQAEANVFAVDLDQDKLSEVKKDHPQVTIVNLDITDWGNESRAKLEALPPIHHLVNNAGIIGIPPEFLLDIKAESVDKVFNVNFKGMLNVTQVVAKGMIEAKLENATIVNMSSISDTVAVAGLATYSCSKAAINMLTKCMALELGEHNIRVNCVRPAMVNTSHVGRVGQSEKKSKVFENVLEVNARKVLNRPIEMNEVADAVLYLSSDASKMVTGSDILVDGGLFTH